jgi:hypothetical protein
MSITNPLLPRLDEMPLWRLLVLLADLEREVGASSPTARLVARLINERLKTADEGELPDSATTQPPEVVDAP